MKINKFTKTTNGMYKINIDDKDIKLSEELILKYELLLKKEITEKELLTLEKENIKYEAYNLAIKYIKSKLRSKKEINDYLNKKGYSKDNIDYVIELLIKQGYINDNNYIESYINDKINLSSEGPLKIKRDLIYLGFNDNLIDKYLIKFDSDLELERIKKIVEKLEKHNNKGLEYFKYKSKNYLINLGYSNNYIDRVLENYSFDDADLREKEYQKLYNKYSKKLSGKELEYKIKQSLYIKGFRK